MHMLNEASNKDEILNIESILKDNFSKVKNMKLIFYTQWRQKASKKFLNPPSYKYINHAHYRYFFEAATILLTKYGMDYRQVENTINNI